MVARGGGVEVEEVLELGGRASVAAGAFAQVQVEGVDVAGGDVGEDLLQAGDVAAAGRG